MIHIFVGYDISVLHSTKPL